MLAALPVGGLCGVALGFFRFLWCDDLLDPQKDFVTRMREKTASRTGQGLSQGPL